MAGFVIYSLDWPKFQKLVESPTPKQLKVFAVDLAKGLKNLASRFDDDDPMAKWPTDAKALAPVVAKRLALPDWYGDLSGLGKELWEGNFYGHCMSCEDLNLGFRVDSDGVYWDVIEVVCEALKVPPNQVTSVAMSTFGTRPFRYHPPAKQRKIKFGDWSPMHSMHPPEEVQRMVAELQSIKPAIDSASDEVQEQYEQELLPSLTRVAKDKRMLFIQVDT